MRPPANNNQQQAIRYSVAGVPVETLGANGPYLYVRPNGTLVSSNDKLVALNDGGYARLDNDEGTTTLYLYPPDGPASQTVAFNSIPFKGYYGSGTGFQTAGFAGLTFNTVPNKDDYNEALVGVSWVTELGAIGGPSLLAYDDYLTYGGGNPTIYPVGLWSLTDHSLIAAWRKKIYNQQASNYLVTRVTSSGAIQHDTTFVLGSQLSNIHGAATTASGFMLAYEQGDSRFGFLAGPYCEADTDCEDNNPCTYDTCTTHGCANYNNLTCY